MMTCDATSHTNAGADDVAPQQKQHSAKTKLSKKSSVNYG
jgi:hypothetical protein